MNKMNRRIFLGRAALTATALSLPRASRAQIPSTDELRVAVIGFGGRGRDHIGGFTKMKGVRVTALCDVDGEILRREVARFKDQGHEVAGHKDVRQLLEKTPVDVVSIATPNHWHALGAIWAVQAGKDVYVEKPVSHNVSEGRRIVEAARKHGRIVQTGTQSRSSEAIKQCIEWLRAGNLGKITVARGLCYKPRPSIGKVDGPQPIPEGIDYDLWCGPAPMAPLRRKRLHYDWHWVWDTGNGDLGNQGIHQMDIARWALGETALSPRVFSFGGRLGYDDDGETPNTQVVFHDYDAAPLIFEVRGLPSEKGAKNMDKFPDGRGPSVGVVLHCEGGMVIIPNYTSAKAYDKNGNEVKSWSGSDDHYENFIKAVKSRKHTDLNADILEGHLSSALCHTGNVSYLTGKEASPGEMRERFQGEKDAVETFGRMQEHLKRNDVDLNDTRATLGAFLAMDPKTERFTNNEEANARLTRDYRKPYVVPEKV
jgi:predicted dehydrogenase